MSISYGGDAERLRSTLAARRTRRFLFSGHADLKTTPSSSSSQAPAASDDAPSNPGKPIGSLDLTLGFTKPGGLLEAIDPPELIAELLGAHAPSGGDGGCLELVFLNGCRSESLGRAIRAAGVPAVVCWRTRCLDAAARLFARVFFQHIAGSRGGGGSLYTRAFEEAKRAVQLCTRDWKGRKVASPCYDVRDPDDPSTAPPPSVGSKKVPVGLPVLLLATGEIVM